MRSIAFTGASALVLLTALAQGKNDVHENLQAIHRRHHERRELERRESEALVKRTTCAFPSDAGLVAVTPQSGNGGWAFAPDQCCTVGRYCPYACPPGQVSMQWDPSVTSYVYPGSRNGGLLCNSDGTLSKPFPDRPYCQATNANIGVQNNCSASVAFCQTVLPGDEDMLIPTNVGSWSQLAVPGPSYWASTAAHYYINPPGVTTTQGCVWGTSANPWGNWSPYVAGANVDTTGNTFIKLGWNPVYLEQATPFRNQMPTWGVKIDCPNGGCNGLPCAIDPSQNSVNQMVGSSTNGAGGGAFCVVTVSPGYKANFIVFEPGSSASTSSSSSGSGWGNVNQGAQFYQSNVLSASASKTAASNKTASATSTSVAWLTSGSPNATATQLGPTGSSNFALFQTASAGTAAQSGLNSTGTQSAVVATATGGASTVEASFTIMLLGLGAMFL